MPVLLEPGSYARVRPLFQEMMYHLAAQSVLDGVAPGRIFVDEPVQPRAAVLIPPNYYRIYASGTPDERLLGDVIHLLSEQSGAERYGCVVHYDTSNSWEPVLQRLFQAHEGMLRWRQYYRLGAPPPPVSAPLLERITISRIEEMTLDDASLENRDLLREELLSESPTLAYFFQRNYGFLARDGQRLVAWCTAEYHDDVRYELGIETLEAYRRQGIATHLASAVIQRAFDAGATEIGWHCWASNTPSIATALKVGFEKARDYPVYYARYTPA